MAAPQIHPTAIVDPAAELAEDVSVGPYAIIEGGAEIGAGVRIYPQAYIGRYARLGPGCQVHMGAVVSHVPQDLDFEDCTSYCRIGAGTVIREHATIHRGAKPESATVIGERCFIMGNVHVGHNCQVGAEAILAQGAILGGYVEIGERAFLSGNVPVHQFCRVGRLALLSADVALSLDCPPFHIAAGRNLLRGLNVVGMKRAGLSREARQAIRQAHRILFREGLPRAEALARVEAEISQPDALELARFCRESRRGVCRLPREH